MKKTYIIILVLILVVLGVIFFTGKGTKLEAPVLTDTETVPTTSVAGEKEFTISGQNFSFTPNFITVKKGEKVKITFKNSDGFHDFKIDEFGVATKTIKGGEEELVEFVADKIGSFEYYCSIGTHRAMGMWGTLRIE